MIVETSQRWRNGRTTFVPPDTRFNPRLYEVAPIPDDTTARAFVEANHYSGTYPAARERFGLYMGPELVGVAVFSHPANDRVLARLPCDRLEGVELGRLVLLDHVPFNAESWTVARCFDLLRREGYRGVVSFSDPMPRETDAGEVVFAGHCGQIYQASNAVYTGPTARRTLRLYRNDGLVLSARAISKVRSRETGWRYVVESMMRRGAAPLAPDASDEARRAWLARWVDRLTRPVRHPGLFTYLFGLDARVKRLLPRSQPYPKLKTPR